MRFIGRTGMVLALALAAACGSTSPSEVGLGEEFVLAPNQTVKVTGTPLTVGFRRVVEDSRCPIDVLCVVEGSAGIEIDIFGSDARNPVLLGPKVGLDAWTDSVYLLRLLDLQPSPTADKAIQPEDYRIRLVVELILR